MRVLILPLMITLAFVALFPPKTCNASFAAPTLETVAVATLIKNIEAKLKIKPNDPKLLFKLARIHAMAYARKATELQVDHGDDTPWFGHTPPGIPYNVVEVSNKADLALGTRHLKKSIELHQQVVKLEPNNHLARLGLAWCTEQSGDKKTAVALYRALIKDALPEDRKIESLWIDNKAISSEASAELIKLLDPKADVEEIFNLRRQSEALEDKIQRIQ